MAEPMVQINIRVTPGVHKRLADAAKKRGYSTTGFANLLFDAAFAARVGQERGLPATDIELDEQVRLVFSLSGRASVTGISKATGIEPDLVEKILDGWCEVAAERSRSNQKG